MDPYSSTYAVSADWTQKEWSERGQTAAPASRGRMPYREAVVRFLCLSWNASGGARQLPTVRKDKGYHFFAIQEAHVDQMLQLEETHNCVLEYNNALLSASRTRLNAEPMGPQGRYRGWWQIVLISPAWGSLASRS